MGVQYMNEKPLDIWKWVFIIHWGARAQLDCWIMEENLIKLREFTYGLPTILEFELEERLKEKRYRADEMLAYYNMIYEKAM